MKHNIDAGELRGLYEAEKLTSRQIGERLGVPYRTVLRYLAKAGAILRNPGDEANTTLSDKAWLEHHYLGEGLSSTQIAERIGCTARTVTLWLTRHGIQARSRGSEKGHTRVTEAAKQKMSLAGRGRRKGSDNPNWKGGIPYRDPERHSSQARVWTKAVKERDGWRCVECGSTDGELHAHHIKPWRRHPEARYDLDNGVTLCPECHQARHSFRFKYAERPTSAPPQRSVG